MPFDPDEFLAKSDTKKPTSGFDPDAFLAGDKTPHKKDKGRSLKDDLLSAPGGALAQVGRGIEALPGIAGSVASGLVKDPMGYVPTKIAEMIVAAPGAIARETGGMMQYMRNLSPENMRGSAPTLPGGEADNHPWMSMAAGTMGSGSADPMKKAIAERPLSLVADVLMGMGATAPGRAVLGRGADMAMAPIRGGARVIADMAPTRRSENAILGAANDSGNPNTMSALLAQNRSPVPGVEYSAGQATNIPELIQLERRSRNNPTSSPDWARFDTAQNTGLFNALHEIVNPATDEAVRAAQQARDVATRYEREGAFALADQGSLEPGVFTAQQAMERAATPILETLNREMAGRHGASAGAPNVNRYVRNNVGRGTEPAASTGEVRKTLMDALNSRAGLDLGDIKSSVKSSDVMSRALVSSIDDSLNRATGGMWETYLDAFRAESPNVNSIQALNNMRTALAEKIRGGASDLAGNPRLTRSYINQIIEDHATNDFGNVIEPSIQRRLDDIRTASQRIESGQNNYRASSTGGGSNTAADTALAGAGHLLRHIPGGRTISAVGRGITDLLDRVGATQLSETLMSQDATAAALRTALEREAARRTRRSSGITPAALAAASSVQSNRKKEK